MLSTLLFTFPLQFGVRKNIMRHEKSGKILKRMANLIEYFLVYSVVQGVKDQFTVHVFFCEFVR